MAKKKNQKKAESQAKKSAVETLRFQAHWGRVFKIQKKSRTIFDQINAVTH